MEEVIISGAGVALDREAPPAKSAASWPSIIAGAFVAASATLILVALGSGIGFASISPWPHQGASVTTFAITTAIWLIVTQWLSAALGGYIAGRLRTRWIGTHTHEVFFRDTAHGLITWAVATILVAAVAAASLASTAGTAGRAVAEAANSPASAYAIDKLYRPATGASGPANSAAIPDARIETAHIVANAFTSGRVPDEDRAYLIDQVVADTGMTQAYAQARVDSFITAVTDAQAKLKADADAAKKAAAEASIYLALSLLIGAFIASVSAALGGRIRDQHI